MSAEAGGDEANKARIDAMDEEDEGDQALTRPSVSVVAWKVGGELVAAAAVVEENGKGAERRVRVQSRPAAGVPVSVLRTWQVMGSWSVIFVLVLFFSFFFVLLLLGDG